jgi:DNA modification methylase
LSSLKSGIKNIDTALVAKHNTPMYLMHKFWARKSPSVVAEYIKAYSKRGDIVLDPFAGSGVTAIEAIKLERKAICLDYNPVMTFIAKMTAMPIDIEALTREFKRIKKSVAKTILRLYETKCPNCGNTASIIGTKWDKNKDQPIEIRLDCSSCGRQKKKTSPKDLELVSKIEKEPIPFWYPNAKLRYSDGKPFMKKERSETITDLFTHRNLIALSILFAAINEGEVENIRNMLKFAFTSALAQNSKLCEDRPTRPFSSAWITHSYWIPQKFMEYNVWRVFSSHFEEKQGILRGKEESQETIADKNLWKEARRFEDLQDSKTALFKTLSVFDLSSEIPSNSVDYCFTDPPYGNSIQYYELTKLWASWLQFQTSFDEEIIMNPQQGKSGEYYFKMMRKAFDEIHKVLKPESYLTVTFHNTKVGIFNMIIRATEYAGFELEKILYQKSSRVGAKALGQPYGSAIGDYYIRFRKSKVPKKTQVAQLSDEQYRRIVIDTVKGIIAKRGEPTAYTFIINGLYPILNSYGYLVTDGKDIRRILESELGREFVLVNVVRGMISGKAWWFKDPSKSVAFLESVPLNDRVESTVIQVLSTGLKISFDDILQFIFTQFPNALTPDTDSVMNILKEYGTKTKDGKWLLKPAIKDSLGQHDNIVEVLCKLGEMANFSVYGDTPTRRTALSLRDIPKIDRVKEIDVLWYKNGRVCYEFEVEHSTAISEAIIRGANIPYKTKRFIVIPKEREHYLAKRIDEPFLKERLISDEWGFIRYGELESFYTAHKKSNEIELEIFDRLNKPPKKIVDGKIDDYTD